MLVSALPSRLCECICSDSPGHADQLDALTCPHLPSLSSLKADSKATLAVISGSECPHLVGHIPAYRGSCTHMCTCAQSSWKFTYTFSITVVAAPPLLDSPSMLHKLPWKTESWGARRGPWEDPFPSKSPSSPSSPCLLPLSYVRAMLMTPENPSNATPMSGHVTT